MAFFQLLTCNVALSGDLGNVVARDATRPITYPELIVLQSLHGEQSITEVFECGATEDRDPRYEKERLMILYGADLVGKHIFPGHGIQLPDRLDRYKPKLDLTPARPERDARDAEPVSTVVPVPVEAEVEVDPVIVAPPVRRGARAAGEIDHLTR